MNKALNEKNDKHMKWTTMETKEKKVDKAVMVPLIISHDGTIHRDSVNRWNHFAKDIKIDWVRIAQNVVRYNVVIVGKFFNKGSWVSEAWRRDHPEEFDGEADGPPEKILSADEREEQLYIEPEREGSVCVRSSGTPPPHGARPTSAGRGNPPIRMCGPISQHN